MSNTLARMRLIWIFVLARERIGIRFLIQVGELTFESVMSTYTIHLKLTYRMIDLSMLGLICSDI